MKAVRGKLGVLSLLSRDEARLFNKIEFDKFLNISNLDEREHFIAEEMHKRNVLQKVKRENSIGYSIYPQKTQI